MSRVVVHIDRLVLPRGADRGAVEAAVREAVGRELARPGAVKAVIASGDRPRVDAGRVRSAAPASEVGAAIGRSVVDGGR